MSESEVQQLIQAAGPIYHCILERNNSGSLKNEEGTPIRFGLGNISKERSKRIKSSDLIGITTVVVTPEMVGMSIGVFTACEVKQPNWNPTKKLDAHELAQKAYLDYIVSRGGIAFFSNSVLSFRNHMTAWLSKITRR